MTPTIQTAQWYSHAAARISSLEKKPASGGTPEREMQAVTIVAAWISAETGVGPAMASGSQTYNGICADLPHAPTNRSRQAAVAMPVYAFGFALISAKILP